jgi:hemerythrin-like domain-containing protein
MHTVLVKCFGLDEGESFVLHTSKDPREWIDPLQQHYPGMFGYLLIDAELKRWSGIVSRKFCKIWPTSGIHELMEAEHGWLDIMLENLVQASKEEDWEGLATLTKELERELQRHFLLEETILFPLVAEKLFTQEALIQELRAEHAESFASIQSIGRLLKEMTSNQAPTELLARATEGLHNMLSAHSKREDSFLYMVFDLLLSREEQDELVRRCKSY